MLVHFVGQEGPGAIAELLLGEHTPSGKLPYTIPKKFEDNPTYTEDGERFPGINGVVRFEEGLDVGYRYYDKFPDKVSFPFGFGLSYGSISLGVCSFVGTSTLSVTEALTAAPSKEFTIQVELSNEGQLPGSEVVQLYCSLAESVVERSPKQLIGFQKVMLAPGANTTLQVIFSSKYSFEYFDEASNSWRVEPGTYGIHVATSAQEIHQTLPFTITE